MSDQFYASTRGSSEAPPRLRFTSVQAQNSEAVVASIASYLGDRLGLPVEFVDDVPWPERERMLDAGEIQVGWICGLPYTWRVRSRIELLAAPVMRGSRYENRPVYFSDVLVRHDSATGASRICEACAGPTTEAHSHSGYNVVRYHVARSGVGQGFFGKLVESGAHQESLRMILDGEVDASAIDSMVLDRELALHPEHYRGRLRTLVTLGPSPAPPWVVHQGVAPALRVALHEALTRMHTTREGRAILEAGQTERFAAVTDRDYDPIREMERVATGVVLSA
ncbi:MAG: PhnD/SsuA/transferrin family substrate-binding protein [Candidatus Eisenbacteria bacterium]